MRGIGSDYYMYIMWIIFLDLSLILVLLDVNWFLNWMKFYFYSWNLEGFYDMILLIFRLFVEL